jgi:2-polyprenyl-3-methyl-5-hydroxy-6-metoxy-1,4-benzoquinol methylase
MTDFDEQWKKVLGDEYFQKNSDQFDYTEKRVNEFKKLTEITNLNKTNNLFGKKCLDAGCGPGRWTYAMQELNAKIVDSFDISTEAINLCKKINPNAYVLDVFELKPNPVYDFVLSWGMLHHTNNTQESFSKVASQVKPGGMLHVMVYDKKFDEDYGGYRGDTCVEKHEEWEKLSFEEKIMMCKNKVKTVGGDIHGWFDAFNPKYNWSFDPNEVKEWFEKNQFTQIKLKKKTHFNSIPTSQVNMCGIKI